MEGTANQTMSEALVVSGVAANVIAANVKAWATLEGVLGSDPVGAWNLTAIHHVAGDSIEGVEFLATFARTADYDGD